MIRHVHGNYPATSLGFRGQRNTNLPGGMVLRSYGLGLVAAGMALEEVGRVLARDRSSVLRWVRATGVAADQLVLRPELLPAGFLEGGYVDARGLLTPAGEELIAPVRVAGQVGQPSSAQRRAEAFGMLAEGKSLTAVARTLGINESTLYRWIVAQGWSGQPGGIGGLDGASRAAARASLVPAVPMDEDYRDERGRLTQAGRGVLQHLAGTTATNAHIARVLGVHRSTIGRELARFADRAGYRARAAQDLATAAAARPQARRLSCPRLRAAVIERLNKRWSPEQVAADLRLSYPDEEDMWVSHETIYQALYVQGKGSLRHEVKVAKATRTGRTSRKPRSKLPPKASSRSWIDEDNHISARPAEVADRAVPGHWEGDLVIGAKGATALITLAERATRNVLIYRLPDRHDAPTVTQALIQMVADLPGDLRRTITWDQGSELAEHADFTLASDCQVYFCDPHSPWQRGTNENTNGLIRDFFPKGTDFAKVTDEEVRGNPLKP
ncbi:IS30 family transposase [Ornithinimicrobium cryptoxanthini]|uniref:IS30 family transposase n=1 Tax=Ornithinimicrobium cryptoxanthini TaxID=2934161 RepID=UPI00351C0B54